MDQSGQITSSTPPNAGSPQPIFTPEAPKAETPAPASNAATPFMNPFASAMAKTANNVAGQIVSPFANTPAASKPTVEAPAVQPATDALAKTAEIAETPAISATDNPNFVNNDDAVVSPNVISSQPAEVEKTGRRIQNDAKFKPTIGKKYINWKLVRKIATISGAVVGGVLIVVLLVALIRKVPSNKHTATPYETDKVFVRERTSGGNYALFNKYNGARVTDFDYTSVEEFIDGYALVNDRNGQSGIIDTEGNEVVAFGDYATITGGGGAYLASVKNSKSAKILLGSGRQIAKVDNSAGGNLITSANVPFFILTKDGKKYTLYSARGDKIKTFDSSVKPSFDGGSNRKVAMVRYGDQVVILNSESYELIAEVEYPNSYEVEKISSDKRYILLKNRDEEQALIAGGKYHSYGDKCNNLKLINDAAIGTNYVICNTSADDLNSFMIDEEGELSDVELDYKKVFFTPADYAIREDGMATIYRNDESVYRTTNVTQLQIRGSGYYIERNDDENGAVAMFVSRTGDVLYESKRGDKVIGSVGESLLILDAAQGDAYRVINRNGEVLAEINSYSMMKRIGENYALARSYNNEKSYLLSSDGDVKMIDYPCSLETARYIDGEGIFVQYSIRDGKTSNYAWMFIAEDKTTVLDGIIANKIKNMNGVLRVEKLGGTTEFYSANGTKFHVWTR